MAILVIWPACCCLGGTVEQDTGFSCCSAAEEGTPGERDSSEDPSHHCACLTKEPREPVKPGELPAQVPALPMPHERDASFAEASISPRLAAVILQWNGGFDPPRLILARYSRWLI